MNTPTSILDYFHIPDKGDGWLQLRLDMRMLPVIPERYSQLTIRETNQARMNVIKTGLTCLDILAIR